MTLSAVLTERQLLYLFAWQRETRICACLSSWSTQWQSLSWSFFYSCYVKSVGSKRKCRSKKQRHAQPWPVLTEWKKTQHQIQTYLALKGLNIAKLMIRVFLRKCHRICINKHRVAMVQSAPPPRILIIKLASASIRVKAYQIHWTRTLGPLRTPKTATVQAVHHPQTMRIAATTTACAE